MLNKETRIRFRNLAISIATVAGLAVLAFFYAEPVLRISVITGEPPFVVKRKIKPLTEYLGQKIGLKVEFRPMRDGEALVDALLDKKLDMAWIDGPYLVRARARSNGGVMPIVQRAEDKYPTSASPDRIYSWAVCADMDANLRQKLTDAFLALDKRNGPDKEILDLQRASRFIPAQVDVNLNRVNAE